MRRITVPVAGREYPLLIGSGILDTLGEQLREVGVRGTLALVQDSEVAEQYGRAALASLEQAGYRATPFVVPSGEGSKCLSQLGALYEGFAQAGLDRGSAVVALGGGVVGDLAGFAAASYLRGIDFVQAPTTLLAQVDASVGGKTGIDLPQGKNLVGAFHQPRLVLIDLDTLASLPDREYRAGLAEVIKYGVIADPEFFAYLESNREALESHQPETLAAVISRSCEIKAEVVGADERESGLRAILNYGHTVGHAVEAVAGYGTYLHGECVAVGMVAAGRLAHRLGLLDTEARERIERLIAAYGLPVQVREPLDMDALTAAMQLDKKTRDGVVRFVLAREIGRVEVRPIPEEEARQALQSVLPH